MPAPRRALVLVDVQQEYFAGPLEIRHPDPALSVRVIGRAIDAATEAGIPVVVVQHDSGAGAPVFDPTTDAFRLHPELESRRTEAWKAVTKSKGSVFAGTDLVEWVRAEGVDTITLVGYMTNNCILASSVEAEGWTSRPRCSPTRPARSRSPTRPDPSTPRPCTAPSWRCCTQLRRGRDDRRVDRGGRCGRGAPEGRPRHLRDGGRGALRHRLTRSAWISPRAPAGPRLSRCT